MGKLAYILAFVALVGCSATVKVKDTPLIAPEGAVACAHSHDSSRNFVYNPPIKEYKHTVLGRDMITYEFILISGETHFLSGDEENNYECNEVN